MTLLLVGIIIMMISYMIGYAVIKIVYIKSRKDVFTYDDQKNMKRLQDSADEIRIAIGAFLNK